MCPCSLHLTIIIVVFVHALAMPLKLWCTVHGVLMVVSGSALLSEVYSACLVVYNSDNCIILLSSKKLNTKSFKNVQSHNIVRRLS